MNKFYEGNLNKIIGVLTKKDKLDKGNKIKLSRGQHDVKGILGYNIVLDNERSYPPKDIVILKNTAVRVQEKARLHRLDEYKKMLTHINQCKCLLP